MLRDILILIATQVALAAELLHPLLVDVDYSSGLERRNGDWEKVDDYYKEDGWRSDKDDKAEKENKGFYRTDTPFSDDIDDQKDWCWNALDKDNVAYWQFRTSASLKNVQTIIVITYDMDLDLSFKMSISLSGGSFSEICGYGACQVGVNDFSAAPLNDFKYLRIYWAKNQAATFCNVFIYDKRNYVMDATITHNLDYPDSDSYDYTLWPNGKMQGTEPWSWSQWSNRYNNPTINDHTCLIQRNHFNDASTRLSPVMFEMPLHMVIHDIFVIGDNYNLRTHIVSAMSQTANSQTIAEIDDYVTSTGSWGQNLNKYGGTSNAIIRQIKEDDFTTNHECSSSKCSEWNVKRVIITNEPVNAEWLFLCGVAIMAEPVPCPPTYNNCANIELQPWATDSADFSYWELDPGDTEVTDAFEFRDTLTDQCFGYSPPAAGCTKTFSLLCNHCTNFQSNCAGMTLVDYTAATFTWSIARTSDTTVEKYEMTITSANDPFNVINHRCYIKCEMSGQEQESDKFVIKENCPPCSATVIGPQPDGTSTPVVGTIPLSKQAQQFSWKWFSDSVRDCGDTCSGIYYKVWCRLDSETTFTDDLDFNPILGTSSSTGDFTLQLLGKSISLHQIQYQCKIVGQSLDTFVTAETSEFPVMFDACIQPAVSCSFNTWSSVKPAGWVAPTAINVFLDGITQSSTFDYSNWYDYFYTLCGSDVCGTVSWQFIDINNDEITTTSLALQPAVSVTQGVDQITMTVGTMDFSTVGTYKIRVKGIMTLHTGAGAWTGPALSNIWSYFTVSVVNPCVIQNACEYTTVVVDPFTASNMVDMTAFFNNIQVLQNFAMFSDTVSNFCDFQCSGYKIDLVYVDTDVALPSDLVTITTSNGSPAVSVKTKNYAYAGTHTVRIKCTIIQGGATISYDYSNAFDLVLDPCDTKSCLYSTLIPLTAADTQPTDYAIGVDNVAGQTDFSLFLNTCGQACTANPDICGVPTYTVVYKSDSTLSPTFSTLTDQTTHMRQSSQTFDLDDVGDHELRIMVQFDMSVYTHAPSTYTPANQILYTSAFTVTIDACFPLPCDYNEILLPSFGFTMPEAMYVRTNGEIVSNYFTHYKDAVSLRCSNPYTDLCGAKVYTIERTDGTAIPGATIAVNWNAATQLYRIDISSSDDTAVDLYDARIHASFADTSYTNVIDETSYDFQITIDAAYPCTVINCALNALVKIEATSTEYLLPQNFVVGTDYTWGNTQFDSWNDTKTEYCRGEPGTKDGVYYASLLAPVCDWPIYELVDANTGEDMSFVFGSNNIDIRFDHKAVFTSRWKVKVRTDDSSLDGLYDVKLQVRLTADSNAYYSNMFTIEVADPCLPYDCADAIFAPVDDSSPTDVEYTFGSGFQSSQGPLWDNSINLICGTKSQTVCGPTRFVLHDASTGEPVTFSHLIYSNKDNVIVSLEITDEQLIGKTLEVYLVGFGYDSATREWYGTNGTSPVFEIEIKEPEEVTLLDGLSEQSGPFFSSFPPDISFDKNPDGPDPAKITYQLSAVAEVSDGEISSLVVQLGSASDFVKFTVSKNEVQFTFELTRTLEAGQYPIKVTTIDDSGQSISKTFQITILDNKTYLVEEENEESEQAQEFQEEEKDPLVAVIESISMSGLLTIKYNRHVLPIKDLTPVTPRHFQIVFEQLSDEIDQTEDFSYQLVSMTPANIYVQLTFSRPLEVSQGVKKDRVHVRMLDKLFMVEDEDGKYDGWQDGDSLAEVLNAQWIIDRIQTEYYSLQTSYHLLTDEVPKQVASLEKMQTLNTQIGIIANMLSGLFWGPLGLHLLGFGSMDYSWVLYNNLQLMTTIGQFNLKMPQNIEAILKSMAPEVNYQFADPVKLYDYLRMQSSDNPNYVKPGYPEPYTWNDPEDRDCVIEDCDDRRLQETAEAQETFQHSRFYGMGAFDLVLITSSQLIVCLIVIVLVAFWGFVLQKSFLHWLPDKIKIVFHYLRNRIFWCLPIRLIMQQYAVITASAMLNLRFRNQQDTVENSVNRAVSIMTLMFLTVGLPTLILVFVTKLPIQYRNPDFLKKFDSLILSVDWNNVRGRCMLGFSLYRKALLIWIAIFNDLTVVQFAFACYVQEFYVAFLINHRPMLGALRNKVEFFNEIVILGTIFLQCTLTDYVPDPEIRYNVFGWIIVTLIYFQLVFNSALLMMSVYHECKRIYKIFRYYIVMRQRKERNLVHNWTVQELGAHKSTDQLTPYLKETVFTRHNKRKVGDLDVIMSVGDLEMSEDNSSNPINLRSDIKIRGNTTKTLSERQRHFRKMMDEFREADADLPTMTLDALRDLKTRHQDEDRLEEKFQIDHGDAKDWHALPSNYSNPEQSVQFSDNTEDLPSLRSIEQRLAPDENDFWLVSTRQEAKSDGSKVVQSNTATILEHTAHDVITERDEEDLPSADEISIERNEDVSGRSQQKSLVISEESQLQSKVVSEQPSAQSISIRSQTAKESSPRQHISSESSYQDDFQLSSVDRSVFHPQTTVRSDSSAAAAQEEQDSESIVFVTQTNSVAPSKQPSARSSPEESEMVFDSVEVSSQKTTNQEKSLSEQSLDFSLDSNK